MIMTAFAALSAPLSFHTSPLSLRCVLASANEATLVSTLLSSSTSPARHADAAPLHIDGIRRTSLNAEQKGHAAWLLYQGNDKLLSFLSELADCDADVCDQLQCIRPPLLLENAATGQFCCLHEAASSATLSACHHANLIVADASLSLSCDSVLLLVHA